MRALYETIFDTEEQDRTFKNTMKIKDLEDFFDRKGTRFKLSWDKDILVIDRVHFLLDVETLNKIKECGFTGIRVSGPGYVKSMVQILENFSIECENFLIKYPYVGYTAPSKQQVKLNNVQVHADWVKITTTVICTNCHFNGAGDDHMLIECPIGCSFDSKCTIKNYACLEISYEPGVRGTSEKMLRYVNTKMKPELDQHNMMKFSAGPLGILNFKGTTTVPRIQFQMYIEKARRDGFMSFGRTKKDVGEYWIYDTKTFKTNLHDWPYVAYNPYCYEELF